MNSKTNKQNNNKQKQKSKSKSKNKVSSRISISSNRRSLRPLDLNTGISRFRRNQFLYPIVAPATDSYALVSTIELNPGLESSFQWLSNIAKNYEKYTFRSLKIIYKPTVNQYTTTSNTGKVVIGFDPDPTDGPPLSYTAITNMQFKSSCMPYQECVLVLDKAVRKQKFVRDTDLQANQNIVDFDIGKIYIAVNGLPGTTEVAIGELWVEYEIILDYPTVVLNNPYVPNDFLQIFAIFDGIMGDNVYAYVDVPFMNDPVIIGALPYKKYDNNNLQLPVGWYQILVNVEIFNETGYSISEGSVTSYNGLAGSILAGSYFNTIGSGTHESTTATFLYNAVKTTANFDVRFATFALGAGEPNCAIRIVIQKI